jgi:hypothetical protein
MSGGIDPSEDLRLDEQKLETLRRWGDGLQDATGEELRAAGRAILLLIEEIERLHIAVWHARADFAGTAAVDEPDAAPDEEPLPQTLRARLRRRWRTAEARFPDASPHPMEEAAVEGEPQPRL